MRDFMLDPNRLRPDLIKNILLRRYRRNDNTIPSLYFASGSILLDTYYLRFFSDQESDGDKHNEDLKISFRLVHRILPYIQLGTSIKQQSIYPFSVGIEMKSFSFIALAFKDDDNRSDFLNYFITRLNTASRMSRKSVLAYNYNISPELESETNGWSIYDIKAEFKRQLDNMRTSGPLKDIEPDAWRLSSENIKYDICPSYPSQFIIPVGIERKHLLESSRFRDNKRFPVISWIEPLNGNVLARSSQPLSGALSAKRCLSDEVVVGRIFSSYKHRVGPSNVSMTSKYISKELNITSSGCDRPPKSDSESPLHLNTTFRQDQKPYLLNISSPNKNLPSPHSCVIDARSYSTSLMNRLLGAGYENREYYGLSQLHFLGIANIHSVRESSDRLREVIRKHISKVKIVGRYDGVKSMCSSSGRDNGTINSNELHSKTYSSPCPFHESLASTQWLGHLQAILEGVNFISDLLHKGSSVLIHCTHGWDRTSQLASLVMLCGDAYYRTLEGFGVLIQKEWCSLGHPFQTRCSYSALIEDSSAVIGGGLIDFAHASPIFIQFLDLVWQMLRQFPKDFEFNEHLLVFLADNIYSCQFGTFLENNDFEREMSNVKEETASIWTILNSQKFRERYLNPDYCPGYSIKLSEKNSSMLEEGISYLRPNSGHMLVFWEYFYGREMTFDFGV